jgi:4,5-DOPA dioxygenase extradiol
MQTGERAVPAWAQNFDQRLKEILISRGSKALVELWPASDDARRSHPTPDHFLPIVYTFAVTDAHDSVRFPIEGFDHSVSMRAILFERGIFPSSHHREEGRLRHQENVAKHPY